MNKIYFFPPSPPSGYDNPYSINYKKHLGRYFHVLEADNRPVKNQLFSLVGATLKADFFIFNWIENIGLSNAPYLRYLIVTLCIKLIKIRKKKIIWMIHNIHPHTGETTVSNKIKNQLFKNANLIISHSKEAVEYATPFAKCKVKYFCHPIKLIAVNEWKEKVKEWDVFIWGTILPYKGVYEFISRSEVQISNLRICIIGKCDDVFLATNIQKKCNENICFENRRASFDEVAAYIKKSKYVLFPYIGTCVSSSGALIDTIVLGGLPIGPNMGAFKDLAVEGIGKVYQNYSELLYILQNEPQINKNAWKHFIKENSWESFIQNLLNNLKQC